MERCILDIVLSHISHLYNFLCHSICSHSDYTPSLNNHTKLVFGASPAVFTHPDCNDPAPHAQPSPRLAHGFLCHTRELQGLGQKVTIQAASTQAVSREPTPLCTCARRTNVRWAPQGTFELHLSFLSRVCCLRDWCAWYQSSFGAARSTQWGSTPRAWWSFSSNYF